MYNIINVYEICPHKKKCTQVNEEKELTVSLNTDRPSSTHGKGMSIMEQVSEAKRSEHSFIHSFIHCNVICDIYIYMSYINIHT